MTGKSSEGLKKVIGISGLSLSIINGVIGAGIFVLPGIVGGMLGSFGVFSYLFCGLMMAAIMLCYAEIGSKVTSSGGSYAYVEAAFGGLPAYIINWLYFFAWSILSSAALANLIATSLAGIFPIFADPLNRSLLLGLLIAFMIWVNIIGVKKAVVFVQVITIIKLLPLFLLIIMGVGLIRPANLHLEQLPDLGTFGDTVLVLFFAFSGFETCFANSGEIKNPAKTIPWSVIISGISILAIYILLQQVCQGVLGNELRSHKDAPLAALAERLLGNKGAILLLLAAAISCFGNVFMDILATPRTLFAMANNGVFPSFLGKVHPRYSSPYLAIFCYGTAIFIFSIAGNFQQLASLASAAILLIYLAVILATMALRLRNMDAKRTFRAPGGWILPVIGLLSIAWLLTSLKKNEMISTMIFIVVVCLLYFSTQWIKRINEKRAA